MPEKAEAAAHSPWVRALLMDQGFQGSTVGEKICGLCIPSFLQCPESAMNVPTSAFRPAVPTDHSLTLGHGFAGWGLAPQRAKPSSAAESLDSRRPVKGRMETQG